MHIRAYHVRVELEWDGRKATSNLKDHGVDFADAATVLFDSWR